MVHGCTLIKAKLVQPFVRYLASIHTVLIVFTSGLQYKEDTGRTHMSNFSVMPKTGDSRLKSVEVCVPNTGIMQWLLQNLEHSPVARLLCQGKGHRTSPSPVHQDK